MELINKDAVVAEIKKRIRLFQKEKEIERQCPTPTQTNIVSLGARIAMLQEIKVFIDTLKAKDVDKIIESAEDHAYLAGSEKMREKIMAKAVDAVVSQVPCANEIIFYSPHTVRKNSNIVINMMNLGLEKGDLVKLIVVKTQKEE